MGFFGFVIVYALRVNMSVAIVAMANSTTERRTQNSSSSEGQCSPTAPRYRWTAEEQGWILSAFFYGYIVTQIPGGYLATRYSGKHIYGLGIFLTSALTLLTPLVSGLFSSIGPLVALRVSEGICEGVTFPAMFALLGKWAPPLEKSKMATLCLAGAFVGNVISFPLTGYLCKCGFGGGWPSVFYTFGLAGVIWYVFWLFLVYETPATHPRISYSELNYIQNAITTTSRAKVTSTPWRSILTSWPVWGIVVAHFCTNWGYYTLLTCLPTYLKDTQKGVDIKSNGLLSGIPFFCQAVVAIIWGQITDFLRARGLPTVVARKFNQFLGMALPALFLLINSYFGTNIVLFVVFLSLAIGSVGFATSGYDCNHLDIAPRYAGVLMGITNTAATIPGILGPTVAKGIANAV
jgi:ACS family sodium-dependent inorganic phosphate cotransporter-like MFS transporter 5